MIRQVAEETWNTFYPDRRKWSELPPSVQDEWIALFCVYDQKMQSHLNKKKESYSKTGIYDGFEF